MKPVIALVGRPNVGKSTLFNRLTRSRDAIVVDVPGVTRDRHYGEGRLGGRPFFAIDTGGLEPAAKEDIFVEMARQTEQAIAEADAVVFITDARSGLAAGDRVIAGRLRRLQKQVWVAANKSEGMAHETAIGEFHELALGAPAAISAAHGEGVRELIEAVLAKFPESPEREVYEKDDHPRVAVVGRPNVGKSTLVNALVGEQRVIAFAEPGTTRDPIEVPFERAGRRYTLIDTAGLRKRGKAGEDVERFSIVKTLQAIEASNVAVMVLDALEGVSDQDAHVAGFILERERAVVIAVNKWDAADRDLRARIKTELVWKLGFLDFAELHFISALDGKGLGPVMRSVDAAYAAAMAKLSTPRLTRTMIAAVARQAPPRKGYARPKLRYAHQGGSNPPRIIIHGNSLDHISDAYRRYLEGVFRRTFKLVGTPLAIEFRTGRNPYAPRKSK
ncbi:MAG: ribosome biogenesis GTPase Der [Betaproteobacteria bacterium RIFCSPLOWO2_02_FULL_66_14]|nr:MAG: ribosome biogenesis GTPase Der [Betaproteobacteria bacterium RIFCSPLOWO2_02_FULL_66_14]